MKLLIVISFSISFLACTTVQYEPTPEQLALADYGSQPQVSELPELVRYYIKHNGFFDPNGAEIEECQNKGKNYALVDSYANPATFRFGWSVACFINTKNRIGGYTGFKTYDYLYKNGKIVSGTVPVVPTSPRSNPLKVLWN